MDFLLFPSKPGNAFFPFKCVFPVRTENTFAWLCIIYHIIIELINYFLAEPHGRVLLSFSEQQQPRRGDSVRVEGVLEHSLQRGKGFGGTIERDRLPVDEVEDSELVEP